MINIVTFYSKFFQPLVEFLIVNYLRYLSMLHLTGSHALP